MRFWIPILIAAAIAGAFWLAVADSAVPPSKLPARVTKLERQVKKLLGYDMLLQGQIVQLQRDQITAAEAESNLEARVSALEAKTGGR